MTIAAPSAIEQSGNVCKNLLAISIHLLQVKAILDNLTHSVKVAELSCVPNVHNCRHVEVCEFFFVSFATDPAPHPPERMTGTWTQRWNVSFVWEAPGQNSQVGFPASCTCTMAPQ